MTINRYYRQEWAPEHADPDILEKALGSHLEPDAQIALNRLIHSPNEIRAEDTAAILVYLEFQRIRVPRQAEIAKALLKSAAMMNSPPELAQALLRGDIEVSDSFRFDFMRTLTGQLAPFFTRMKWRVVEAGHGLVFVTSDSPVSFFNREFLPPTDPGPGLVGTSVLFPIDSKHLLVMSHPEFLEGSYETRTDIAPEPKREDGGISVSYEYEWDAEQVSRQNWLMGQLAHRFVVGADRQCLESAVEADLS